MNTILADSLTWVADNLESRMKAGEDLNTVAQGVLKEIMDKHRNVIFGGNG